MAIHKYASCAAAIGVIQVIEAAALFSDKGIPDWRSLTTTGIEFVWAIASLVVAIRVKHRPTRILAIAFFGYNALGWAFAIITSTLHPPVALVVPLWSVIEGGVFGCIYSVASLYVAKKP